MESQFWWFFDVAAISVLLISIYLSGKRGFSKTIFVIIGYILSITAASAFSGGAADIIYDKFVKQRCQTQIEAALADVSMTQKTKSFIENLGYGVILDEEQIGEIFSSGGSVSEKLYEYVNSIENRTVDTAEGFNENISEGFADIAESVLSENMHSYASNCAAKLIEDDADGFGEALRLLQTGADDEAVAYIEENYTADAVRDIIKVICFIIILFILTSAVRFISVRIGRSGKIHPLGYIFEHALGGVLGIAEGIMIIFLAAVAVRIIVVLGNDEMMFFNSKAIDETFLFKHIYKLTMKL
ncbi:MAG: hypothetical protein LUG26_01235 [Ruminococcus sp.]|nr:hypothetical protein [Ruminococcus sp.]